ncbi:MAG: VanZ family protein [Candidatus Omnitrophota bacterium]
MVEACRKIYPRFSKLTLSAALFIIISASFMRQVMSFAENLLGQEIFKVILILILAVPAFAVLIFILRSSLNLKRVLTFCVVLGAGLALSWQIKIPVEKAHILEYGVLGWLAAKDLISGRKLKGVIFASIFIVFVGTLDEVFQYFLPYRVYEIRDIGLNVLGGAWGITLYLSSINKYSVDFKSEARNPKYETNEENGENSKRQ